MISLFFVDVIVVLCLGLVAGSFLNVVLVRFGTGEGIGGRSHCVYCKHILSPADLVPILSFLYLRGRCRYCQHPIFLQYPLVELAAAALSLGIFLQQQSLLFSAINFLLWMTLLFLFVYDFQHKLLPLGAIGVVFVLSIFSLAIQCDASCYTMLPSLFTLFSGVLVALPLLFLSLISSGRWMGWGDGLLMLPLGLFLGLSVGFTALVIAFWSGAIIGLILVAYNSLQSQNALASSTLHTQAQEQIGRAYKGVTMKSEIPFAPFLIVGAVAAYFFHADLFSAIFTHF